MANKVDLDELAHDEFPVLDLRSLQIQLLLFSRRFLSSFMLFHCTGKCV